MKFLNAAEKMKKIRKQLKMKQEDLADDNITRGFISMIEIGKRTFSKDTAEVITRKFKAKAEKLGIKLDIDDDYLLRDSKDEAEFYCNQKLKNIEDVFEADEIINIAKEYQLEKLLAEAYMQLAEAAFNKTDYIAAYINYVNALSYYKNANLVDKGPYLYNRLGHCKFNQFEITEALTYFNLANYHAVLQDNDSVKKMSLYNIALCNKKLNRTDAALEYIELYLSICDKEEDFMLYIYANVLKSICYEDKNLIDISFNILTDLLKEFKNTEDPLISYVFDNLAELYLKKRDFKNSLSYFNKAEKIRSYKDLYNLSHTIIEKSSIYVEQKLYDEAVLIINYGLNMAEKNNDIEYLIKGYFMLADINSDLKHYEEVENIYEKLIGLLKKNSTNNLYKEKLIGVYVRLAQLYFEQNDSAKLSKTLFNLNSIVGV